MNYFGNEPNNTNPIRENNTSGNYAVLFIIFIIIAAMMYLFDDTTNQKHKKMMKSVSGVSQNNNDLTTEKYSVEDIDEVDDNLSNYKSVNDLEIGKYYVLTATKEEKYNYNMYLSKNSEDGKYASFIYYFPDETRIIVNLPPSLLIKDEQIYDFSIKSKLTKSKYGVKDYKMDVEETDIIYANNAEFRSAKPIDIGEISSVSELVEGQNYFFKTNYVEGEIDWVSWPNYMIYNLPDGNEIWINIEGDEKTFNRKNVYVSGQLSIEKRFKSLDDTGFTVYIIK